MSLDVVLYHCMCEVSITWKSAMCRQCSTFGVRSDQSSLGLQRSQGRLTICGSDVDLKLVTGDRECIAHYRERHVFFFQAEDGIRDDLVTGVQTCALPI